MSSRGMEKTDLLKKFNDFCIVDKRLTNSTAKLHQYNVDRFLRQLNVSLNEVKIDDVREYLKNYLDASPSSYANQIKSFRVFFRDFLERGDIVKSFKFPERPFNPKNIPTKIQLKMAYDALDTQRERTIFLLYATTGLRNGELKKLQKENVDRDKCMIIPKHSSRTKNTWVSFFNQEAKLNLEEYLASRNDNSSRLVAISTTSFKDIWKKATNASGIKITPQVLREWFCCEMANLGVQDRFVDAFCGRTPKSVLARHYTDYSPDRLKEIYDKAQLRVLS